MRRTSIALHLKSYMFRHKRKEQCKTALTGVEMGEKGEVEVSTMKGFKIRAQTIK